MSAYDPPATPSGFPPQRKKQPGPSLKLVLGGGCLTVILAFVVLAIVSIPKSTRFGPGPRAALLQTQLPDGSVLVLESVTFGQHHQLDFEVPRGDQGFGGPTRTRHVSKHTSENSLAIWLTRRDPNTGEYMPLDNWLRCVATDVHGFELQDDDAEVKLIHRQGGSSRSGTRPFGSFTSGPNLQGVIVGISRIPRLRHDGDSFPLKFIGPDESVLAEFSVPNPDPLLHNWPEWQPEPLPASRPAGNLSVTLEKLQAQWRDHPADKSIQRLVLSPEFNIERDGQPDSDWHIENSRLQDALGNESALFDCSLCPHESAWKLTCQLYRKPEAQLGEQERVTFKNVRLPQDNQVLRLARIVTIGDVQLKMQYLGGRGRVEWNERTNNYSHGSTSSSGRAGDAQYILEREQKGNSATYTVQCPLPHLAIQVDRAPPRLRLTISAVDQAGRPIANHGPIHTQDENYLFFFEPAADSQELELTVGAYEGYELEFLVAPPQKSP